MLDAASPAFGTQLNPELRRDLEEVSSSIPVDDGGGASRLKVLVLAELIVANGLTRVVEIGVYRGRLMLPLARLMARLSRGEVVGSDPYSADAAVQTDVERDGIDLAEWPATVDWEGIHQDVVEAISRWELKDHARLVRERSGQAAVLPHLRDGGLLVMDDISWPSIRPIYEALASEHELVFSLFENGLCLWPDDVPNDFAVLRVSADRNQPAQR